MKRARVMLSLGGLAIFAGLVLASGQPEPSTEALAIPPAFEQVDSTGLDLQCGVKVRNGLAQCGSQASSCKNCHEVKGEDPVNAEGEWHISHAFGDFCEFCHGGNVQATEKEAAHQGLIAPLDDVKTNCSSCHEDYEPLAQGYAAALGVTIGTGGDSTEPPMDSSNTSEPAPTPQPLSDSEVAAPSGSEIVDYVAQYSSGNAPAIGAGNLVVGALLLATVVGGGIFVYWNEKRLRMADRRSPIADGKTGAAKAPASTSICDLPMVDVRAMSPELAKLLPTLQSLDPRTLRALRVILSDRKRGEEMLQSLSAINFAVLEEMRRLDKRELSLLLALASDG